MLLTDKIVCFSADKMFVAKVHSLESIVQINASCPSFLFSEMKKKKKKEKIHM